MFIYMIVYLLREGLKKNENNMIYIFSLTPREHASAESMLAEEFCQIAEGFVEVPVNLMIYFQIHYMSTTS